ncbi:Predicted dehydrogenase [bacterium A37T11]|nr:Predicted dehydrogenase [bacterium A37T11]
MDFTKIRIGIVGASTSGWASISHIPALKLLPEFELTAVSTTNLSSAREAAEKFGAKHAFDNEQDLVSCPDVDLVIIAVKVPYHYELAKAAIANGKMIYCEWPLGNGLQEAKELLSLAKAKGIRHFVGLQAVSLPETAFMKQIVGEGLIGEVLSSSILASAGGWVSAATEEKRYLLDPANGATMLDIPFGHTVAAYARILGDFKTISATLARRRKEVPLLSSNTLVPQLSNDQIAVSGILKDGIVSNIHYRSGFSTGTTFLWEINGTKGDIVVTGPSGHYQMVGTQLHYAPTGEKLQPLEVPAAFLSLETTVPAQPIYGLYYAYKALLADLKNNTAHVPTFEDGVHIHQLLEAIKQSHSEEKVIHLEG